MYQVTTDEITLAGDIQAWISRPTEAGRYPAIVLLHGRTGPSDSFRQVAVRFAEEGIVGVALNYMTHGTDVTNPEALRAIGDALGYLRTQNDVAPDRLVLAGYCKGGGLTYLGLANHQGFGAGVIWHGGLFNQETSERSPENPFDAAQRIEVPILIIHGASDQPVPVADVYRLAQRLDALRKRFELKVYSGADHVFTLPGGAAYVPEAADDAFREAVIFIRKTFGLPVGTVAPLTGAPVAV